MKKSYNPISDVRNETVDLTKRLYRTISDAAQQLDEVRRDARCVDDLFAPRAAGQRARLRDACERLLMDGGGGGAAVLTAHAQMRKAEELLWRKAYYDVVAVAKRIRKGSNANGGGGGGDWQLEEMFLVHNHITAGIGLYHHLLWRLQSENSHLNMNGISDSLVFFPDHGLKKGRSGGHSTSNGIDKMADEVRRGGGGGEEGGGGGGEEWAQQMAHRCLICLGDLCRYLVDLQPGWDYGLATHYYTQALLLKPEAGLPHNQLGTMAGAQNYSLDAVYHYMRCLSCAQTFEGADGNLNQLLDKCSWNNQLSPVDCACALARTVARLLSCARTWFCNRPPPSHPPMHKLCDDLILDLRECLHAVEVVQPEPDAEPDDLEQFAAMVRRVNNRPTRMSEEMLFKSVAIVLMCLHNLSKTGSSELSRGVSLQLSVMAQVLHQIMLKVESVLPPPPTPPPVANGLANRRRRRRRRKHRTSDSAEDESSDMSQGEEVEYVSDTDSDASEEKLIFDQNSSDSDEEVNGKTLNGTDSIEEDETVTGTKDSSKFQHYKDNLTFQHLHRLSQQGFLLQTIKICFDWLGSNMETLKSCGQTCKLFMDQAVSFFNHLLQVPYIFDSNNDENLLSNNCDRFIISDDLAPLPLPEDICLRDLPPLVASQQHIDWKRGLQANITSEEKTYLRIYRLLSAGVRLAKEDCGWTFVGGRKWFVTSRDQDATRAVNRRGGKHVMTSRNHATKKKKNKSDGPLTVTACNGNANDHKPAEIQQRQKKKKNSNGVTVPLALASSESSSKGKLMGELWLRAEVRELETKVRRSRHAHAHLPPYLVLDAEALIAHHALTKQLVLSKKFIVLIPAVVVSSLDEQKRESGSVRETTRWLEGQFRHGNRFVRAQRPNEHLTLPLIKYPKKKDKEAWMFFQIVECCHFLSNQGGKDQGLVTLLTGSANLLQTSNSNGFSPLGIASSAGINIEHIESFHSKWKSSTKSHG